MSQANNRRAAEDRGMTPEQWNDVEGRLEQQCRTVFLDCDGYLVRLELDRVGKRRLGITVHVDGWFKVEWFVRDRETGEWPDITLRFFQPCERSLHRREFVHRVARDLGKKRARQLGLYEKHQIRKPFWNSPRSLRRHFCRENTSIELLSSEVYFERLEEKRNGSGAA